MGTSTSAARVGSFLSPYIVFSVSLILLDEALIVCLTFTRLLKKKKQIVHETFDPDLIQVDFLLHMRTLYFF